MIIGGQYIIEGLYSVFMYCPGSKEANRKYSGGGSCARKDHIGMYRV